MSAHGEDQRIPCYLTSAEVAEKFSVSVRTVYGWVDSVLLPYARVGRRLLRFSEESISEFLHRSSMEAL